MMYCHRLHERALRRMCTFPIIRFRALEDAPFESWVMSNSCLQSVQYTSSIHPHASVLRHQQVVNTDTDVATFEGSLSYFLQYEGSSHRRMLILIPKWIWDDDDELKHDGYRTSQATMDVAIEHLSRWATAPSLTNLTLLLGSTRDIDLFASVYAVCPNIDTASFHFHQDKDCSLEVCLDCRTFASSTKFTEAANDHQIDPRHLGRVLHPFRSIVEVVCVGQTGGTASNAHILQRLDEVHILEGYVPTLERYIIGMASLRRSSDGQWAVFDSDDSDSG